MVHHVLIIQFNIFLGQQVLHSVVVDSCGLKTEKLKEKYQGSSTHMYIHTYIFTRIKKKVTTIKLCIKN